MLTDDLFKLFEKTGEVGIYLLYRALKDTKWSK